MLIRVTWCCKSFSFYIEAKIELTKKEFYYKSYFLLFYIHVFLYKRFFIYRNIYIHAFYKRKEFVEELCKFIKREI